MKSSDLIVNLSYVLKFRSINTSIFSLRLIWIFFVLNSLWSVKSRVIIFTCRLLGHLIVKLLDLFPFRISAFSFSSVIDWHMLLLLHISLLAFILFTLHLILNSLVWIVLAIFFSILTLMSFDLLVIFFFLIISILNRGLIIGFISIHWVVTFIVASRLATKALIERRMSSSLYNLLFLFGLLSSHLFLFFLRSKSLLRQSLIN